MPKLPWNFFRPAHSVFKDLIENEAHANAPEYRYRDEQITKRLVNKALRAARFQYRLRFWRYVGQAVRRWATIQYEWYVKQRLVAPIKRVLNRTVEKEKGLQKAEQKPVDNELEPV